MTAHADAQTAAATSHLTGIRARRQKAVEALTVDLKVPNYDPPIYVRYGAVDQDQINECNKAAASKPDGQRLGASHANLLVKACRGVFEIVDGQKVSIDEDDRSGEWLKFGEQLGELLGVPVTKATDAVKALYAHEGMIIATGEDLLEFSRPAIERLESDQQGN